MEAIERRPEFFDELEKPRARDAGRSRRSSSRRPMGGGRRRGPERITQRIAERVPVTDREAQVIAERFAVEFLGGVVMLEGKRVPRLRAFVFDSRNVGEC